MLNKLSYNLVNALNEAEDVEIKKTTYTAETYLKENCSACKEKLQEDIESEEEKESIEERLASLRTQLEVDGDQLAYDEREAIKAEIAELENQLDTEEVDNKIMNESAPGTDAYDKLVSGDDIFFRDEAGEAILGHYAASYPKPEEFDEGLDEEQLRKAQEAANNGDVWEFLVVDETTLQPTGETVTICYGEDDLMNYLKCLRQVEKISKLEEDKIEDEIEDARKDSIKKGLLAEEYSERLGGNPEDFVNDCAIIKSALLGIYVPALATKLAQQMVTDFRDTLDNQMNMTITKYNLSESEEEPEPRKLTREEWNKEFGPGANPDIINAGREPQDRVEIIDESENESEVTEKMRKLKLMDLAARSIKNEGVSSIAEAEVKGLKEVKSQGNIYMLEDETNKFIVGENYNAEEGLIEKAEIYDNKEEANKDYLGRCEITGGESEE